MLIASEEPPTAAFIRDRLWAGDASSITFQLQAKVQETPAEYIIDFKTDGDNLLIAEALSVEDVKVISIKDGKGTVQDENGRNETTYKSKKLALKSAGDYGNKPSYKRFDGLHRTMEVLRLSTGHYSKRPLWSLARRQRTA